MFQIWPISCCFHSGRLEQSQLTARQRCLAVIVNSPANVSLSKCFQVGERQRQPIGLYGLKRRASPAVNTSTQCIHSLTLISVFLLHKIFRRIKKTFQSTHLCYSQRVIQSPKAVNLWDHQRDFFPDQTYSRISSRVWTYVV